MITLDGVTPYPLEFAERYRALGYWEDRTLGQWFDDTCARFSERIALVAAGEQITYRQLAERMERLALHLLEQGLRPLDRFVMHLTNIPEFVYLYFALQKVGAIPIMALAGHRYCEIEQFVGLSQQEQCRLNSPAKLSDQRNSRPPLDTSTRDDLYLISLAESEQQRTERNPFELKEHRWLAFRSSRRAASPRNFCTIWCKNSIARISSE